MSLIRKIVIALVPRKTAGRIEAESRRWFFHCEICGNEQSIWDAGGIRAGAKGTPRIRRSCSACGQKSWQRLSRKD